MIKLTAENTLAAIERCKQLKPKVKFIKIGCMSFIRQITRMFITFGLMFRTAKSSGFVNAKRLRKAWFVITSSPMLPICSDLFQSLNELHCSSQLLETSLI
ncbi:MAG: hypothetical protein ABJA66_09525 [Actinomycetota bacterium]